MGNILNVVFEEGSTTYRANDKIWQYNYGQILRLQGFHLPKAVEVQFSYVERGGKSITRIATSKDDVSDVTIPDSMLENSDIAEDYKLYAFVYVEDGNSGTTEYKIAISVRSRPKPELHETPEAEEIFKNTIKLVNQYADEAEQSKLGAESAKESAKESAESAKKSADSALTTKQEVEQLGEELEQERNNAVSEVNELKQESLDAIETAKSDAVKTVQVQEETSKSSVTKHTNEEIDRANASIAEPKKQLASSISNSIIAKTVLDGSIANATQAKQALDSSISAANTAKTNLDNSITKANSAKSALDSSISTANISKANLDATNKTATNLDTSLQAKIEEGNALKDAIVSEGQKQLEIVENASSEIVADREQINQNKADIALKANQVSLDVTNRKLDALWKLNQGVSYQFEEDNTETYKKEVPTGAKIASVKNISGRSIVWNQICDLKPIPASINNLVLSELDNCGVVNGTITTTTTTRSIYFKIGIIKKALIQNHVYHIKTISSDTPATNDNFYYRARIDRLNGSAMIVCNTNSHVNFTSSETTRTNSFFYLQIVKEKEEEVTFKNAKFRFMLFDLTQMFGAGNEPTAEEFEAMFPDNYYEYNDGEVISAGASEMIETSKNIFDKTKAEKTNFYITNNMVYLAERSEGISYTLEPNKTYTIFKPQSSKGYIGISINKVVALQTKGIAYSAESNVSSFTQTITTTSEYYVLYMLLKGKDDGYILEDILDKIIIVEDDSISNYSQYHQNVYQIPDTIKNLDGYGWGVDSVKNELDLENKQYIQRIGLLDLGSLVWSNDKNNKFVSNDISDAKNPTNTDDVANILCAKYNSIDSESVYSHTIDDTIAIKDSTIWIYDSNALTSDDESTFKKSLEGIDLYYELAEPIVYDISDLLQEGFLEAFEVEAGGTLTFKNTLGDGYQIPIQSTVEYVTKLSEVADTEVTS